MFLLLVYHTWSVFTFSLSHPFFAPSPSSLSSQSSSSSSPWRVASSPSSCHRRPSLSSSSYLVAPLPIAPSPSPPSSSTPIAIFVIVTRRHSHRRRIPLRRHPSRCESNILWVVIIGEWVVVRGARFLAVAKTLTPNKDSDKWRFVRCVHRK